MSGAVVEAEGLRMQFGRREVLRGIDLRVRAGELLAVLGPNGAGKTTTMEVLEGFQRRSSGAVQVLGRDPDHADDGWRARIGVVLQSWRDHGRWTVGELLGHTARYHVRPHDVGWLVARVGLQGSVGVECRRLSGGQRRRMDVALGLVGRPELLFLDEPTAGLDPVARRELHDLVAELHREDGVTVLLTTHDLAEAEALADRVTVLAAGEVLASGTVAELAASTRRSAEVRWTEQGRPRTEQTPDPSSLVWQLHQRFGGPVPGLEVRRPTLEETYLQLVHGAGRAGAPAPGPDVEPAALAEVAR